MEVSNILEVAKNRQLGIVDYLVGMFYEPESRRLKNSVAEHIVYGWQDPPTQVSIPMQDEFSNNDFEQDYNPFGDNNDDLPW